MTDIVIFRNKKQEVVKYTVTGHTGFNEAGTDIVCSAVSCAAMTALNGLTDVLGLTVGYEIADGSVECVLPEELEPKERYGAQVLLESMVLTMRDLAKQYETYISVTELEV